MSKRSCKDCGKPVNWLIVRIYEGSCLNCWNDREQRQVALKIEEARRAARERFITRLPQQLQTGDLCGYARAVAVDSGITVAALALWPNETNAAERLVGEIGTRLLTAGFVGDLAGKQTPFGIVALSSKHLWRIELGNVLADVTVHDYEPGNRRYIIDINRDGLRAEFQMYFDDFHLTVAGCDRPPLQLVIPGSIAGLVDYRGTHPLFSLAPANREAADTLVRALSA